MIENNTIINKNSIINKIDPRIRILFCFFYSIIIAITNNIIPIYIALILPIILIFFNLLNFKYFLKRISMVNGFILLIWIFIPLYYPGESIYNFKTLHITKEGLNYAFLITLKSNEIIITTIFLIGISSFIEIAHALSHLKVSKKLIFLLFFCYRYIYDISNQYQKLKNSLKIKGFKPKTNFYTYKIYGYLIGMLFIKSYDRAERVLKAMICRGFDGTFYTINHFKIKKLDFYITPFFVFYLIVIIGASFWNH